MDESKLRDALKACLADCDFPVERQRAVLREIRGENIIVKKKISLALVCAIVMILTIGGAAIASSLGVFGQTANDAENEQSISRLEMLEEVADTYDETRTMMASDATVPVAEAATDYAEMLERQYDREFNLVLNQVYFDGQKLYYSYTLSTNSPLESFSGIGAPTGFNAWDVREGTYSDNFIARSETVENERKDFFAGNPVGWIAHETMYLGDGARTADGTILNIYDSSETYVDDHTIRGFQEVRVPDGYVASDSIDIELSILYNTSVIYQDDGNIYSADVREPETRGIIRIPFTVKKNGDLEMVAGSVETETYTAQAAVSISDIDVFGEVIFDSPEWQEIYANLGVEMDGEGIALAINKAQEYFCITDYTLYADGVEYRNHDLAMGVNGDGSYVIQIRFDLPESVTNLVLKPDNTQTADASAEDIVLMR